MFMTCIVVTVTLVYQHTHTHQIMHINYAYQLYLSKAEGVKEFLHEVIELGFEPKNSCS
jgi:hypothetical protein